ncbi:response regulator transcription factor [Paenibacillus harenae]|uniref:DNA-binding response OmpR family regulator n=1 Tax=Paenibacillus harenae TaxID=306543 RepID=A0ABT9U7X5_PAEHA|nr:response regulator transcription factor [Paenibacillus harenae]MDQ0115091.1 DNA-binding response OmpR family regulator [Paenibacillus harenae]
MYTHRIVIVDDEPSIVKMVQLVLQKEGFQHIHAAGSCAEALDTIARHEADIVLLDIMLPDGSGLELCPKIRALGNPHILFMTAKASDLDILTGFAMGGDDYITKPFNPLEIAARIKARLRRIEETGTSFPRELPPKAQASAPTIYRFGRFQLSVAAGELLVGGAAVPCPAQEFQLLLHFCKHPGIVFSKAQLYESVWGMDGLGDDNTVMVHIRRLRERIELDPSEPTHLITVRGLGYKLSKEQTGV